MNYKTITALDLVDTITEEDIVEEQDLKPHLVFLIPGIRTDGIWTQDLMENIFTWEGREVIFRPVRGDGKSNRERLSTFHLFTRINLENYKNSFKEQILFHINKNTDATISVFAHSMGSALFAEIIEDVSKDLKGSNRRLSTVAFIGSVSLRRYGKSIAENCDVFVNDIGVNDYWPYIASIIRPNKYNDVGFLGFRNAYTVERYFPNDHFTCTSQEHLVNYLIPLIDTTGPIRMGPGARHKKSYNFYVNLSRIFQILKWLVFALLGFTAWFIFT